MSYLDHCFAKAGLEPEWNKVLVNVHLSICACHVWHTILRVGPDIWGLQNREKGPNYFSKKGYFGHKRDFPKIPFQKGFLTPKQGSKGQKGYPAPPCILTGRPLIFPHFSLCGLIIINSTLCKTAVRWGLYLTIRHGNRNGPACLVVTFLEIYHYRKCQFVLRWSQGVIKGVQITMIRVNAIVCMIWADL